MPRKNETEGTKLMLALISLLGTRRPDPELSDAADGAPQAGPKEAPPLPLADIAEVLGVDIEQARELVERLATMGAGDEDSSAAFNMYIDDNDAVVVNASFDKVTSSLRLNPAEARALDSALDLAGIEADDPLRHKLIGAAVVPTLDRDELERVFTAVDRSVGSSAMATLLKARDQHHWVSFAYRKASNGQVTQQHVEPLTISYDHASWYLDGYSRTAGALRTYRLDSMADVIDKGPFEERDDLPLPASNGPYDLEGLPVATLEVDACDLASGHIDWPGLRMADAGNGGANEGRARVTVPYRDDLSWLARQIAAQGGHVAVIAPPQLAEAVADLARADLEAARSLWGREAE